jgi:hypothetical protein
VLLGAAVGSSGVHAHRLAATILTCLGEAPAALLAARSAVTAARHGSCPSTVAAAAATYADTLVALGEPVEAETLCRRTIAVLASGDPAGPLLRLSASRAATAAHAPQSALAWLDGTAGRVEEADPRYSCSALEIDLQAVRVALRLGSLHDAARLAARLDVAGFPTRVPRSRGYITIASVYARAHNPSAVLIALVKAEGACAEELRYNAEARGTIAALLTDCDALIRADISALAARAGFA